MKSNIGGINQQRRSKRSKRTGEAFTPPSLVNEMLDQLPETIWAPEKTFCDHSCGTGNMLLEVLRRKLDHKHDPLQALSTIYGTELMDDNVKECRLRFLKMVSERGAIITREMVACLLNNIVVTRLKEKYKKGCLDYHFEFYPRESRAQVDYWMNGIQENQWLQRFESEDINVLIDYPEEEPLEIDPEISLVPLLKY
jgi:hypothetical protein